MTVGPSARVLARARLAALTGIHFLVPNRRRSVSLGQVVFPIGAFPKWSGLNCCPETSILTRGVKSMHSTESTLLDIRGCCQPRNRRRSFVRRPQQELCRTIHSECKPEVYIGFYSIPRDSRPTFAPDIECAAASARGRTNGVRLLTSANDRGQYLRCDGPEMVGVISRICCLVRFCSLTGRCAECRVGMLRCVPA